MNEEDLENVKDQVKSTSIGDKFHESYCLIDLQSNIDASYTIWKTFTVDKIMSIISMRNSVVKKFLNLSRATGT